MAGSCAQHIAAGFFNLGMAPLERRHLRRIRRVLLSRARGDVLEIGAGSGVNLAYYPMQSVTRLTLSDTEDRRAVYERRFRSIYGREENAPEFTVTRLDTTRLPFDDDSFDTVVATLLFCSVRCAPCGFEEIRRVLRPDGRYLFLEHVRPRDRYARGAFDLINPVWRRISRGCNLNRETLSAITEAGFDVVYRGEAGHGVFAYGEAV